MGSPCGVMMPNSPKLESFPRAARPARARPLAHRIGGSTDDLYLSAQLGIGSGHPMSIQIWGRQLTTRGLKLGPRKGVILAAQNEPKLRVSPMVYHHAGLEIGSAVPYAIPFESNMD